MQDRVDFDRLLDRLTFQTGFDDVGQTFMHDTESFVFVKAIEHGSKFAKGVLAKSHVLSDKSVILGSSVALAG